MPALVGQRVQPPGDRPGKRADNDRAVAIYEKKTDDRVSTQRVCGDCHTRLYNTNTRRPGLAIVRAGTLDRSEELTCRAHIFTGTKQQWFDIPAGVPSWIGAAPSENFYRALIS